MVSFDGGLQAKSMTSQRNRAEPSQDGGYALLWQRYDNNKMVAMCYYRNVMIFYIFNSTVIDWTCYMFFLFPCIPLWPLLTSPEHMSLCLLLSYIPFPSLWTSEDQPGQYRELRCKRQSKHLERDVEGLDSPHLCAMDKIPLPHSLLRVDFRYKGTFTL